MTSYPPLPADLVRHVAAFCRQRVILVASDFDGVLAPFVEDPMQARALPGAIEALAHLGQAPDTHVAVVSGRDLDTLTHLTGLHDSGVTRIGGHGAQTSRVHGSGTLDADQTETLEALTSELYRLVKGHPGARLELKPTATVVHTRGMPWEAAEAAVAATLEVAGRHTGVKVLEGKSVVEMSVLTADKGAALRDLADEVAADAVAYFGDDVTDEYAFEVLGEHDLTVKVGPGETAAQHRVEGPEQVLEVLRHIVAARMS